ncbi:MAG: DUF5320 domain-containing protein [Candidatus Bathyarchaeota archaeon]
MPRGDKTGPSGAGPMTGRAAGYCAGYSVPGYTNRPYGYGRGMRRGRGFGRGWGRGYGRRQFVYSAIVPVQPISKAYPTVLQQQTPKQELIALENYKKDLEAEKTDLNQEMDGVKARIEELKTKIEK